MPKISVIIPIFKVENYIERCARSLFEQTLEDIEYIFIDDSSPDKSLDILNKVLKDYPIRQSQVTIFKMERNRGQAAVREFGVKHATGDYIIHCDSDDWLDVNAYQDMYNVAIKEKADMVVCDFCYVNNGNKARFLGCHDTEKTRFFNNLLLQKDCGCLWNKMFRRGCYQNMIWPNGDMGEDLLMCLQLIYNSNKVTYQPEALYYYNMNSSSISTNMDKEAVIHRFKQSLLNADLLVDFFKKKNILNQYHEEVDRMLFNKKNLLRPLIREKKYYKLWMSTFPDLNYKILFNRQVSLGMKVKHILALMNLYHKTW